MATSIKGAVVLELKNVDELFNAPDVNPFSAREVEILGETGIDRLRKRSVDHWPRKSRSSQVILRLPPEEISPGTASEVGKAIRCFCEAQIERNRARRRHAIEAGLRQLALACVILLFDAALLYWVANHPVGLLSGSWRGILMIVAVFAGLVALWDAMRSLAFDWIPFVQDDAGYRSLSVLDIIVEPQTGEPGT
jgi:hypothetical protein